MHSIEPVLSGLCGIKQSMCLPHIIWAESLPSICTHMLHCVKHGLNCLRTGRGTSDSFLFWSLITCGVSLAWYWLSWGSHIQSDLTKSCLSRNIAMVHHSSYHSPYWAQYYLWGVTLGPPKYDGASNIELFRTQDVLSASTGCDTSCKLLRVFFMFARIVAVSCRDWKVIA